MKSLGNFTPLSWRWLPVVVCLCGLVPPAAAGTVSQSPLFLTQSAKPVTMLNLSKDHQLYFKAFDDYSDLDGDGTPETTYKHSFNYYGYFDNGKCYSYDTASLQFEPESTTSDKYCNGNWSGNFLNWASMTRIDTIRKILYGGLRSSDTVDTTKTTTNKKNKTITTTTPGVTTLERAYLPNDAHSFAKFYNGSDLTQLTPFSAADVKDGITLCNTTVSSTQLSQNVTDAPLIRVAKGNYALWAGNERWQCRWSGEKSASNGNNSTLSGISAASGNPNKDTNGLGEKDYYARIQVCASKDLKEENCKLYPSGSLKPIGLLQTYGDNDDMRFGLLTGSYSKNKSGGVLRKNISSLTDEVNSSTDGTFKAAPATGGIISTLNSLRIFGYRNDDGTYFGVTNADDCIWGINTFNNGRCSNWGNPQSEILLESLRYLAGESASTVFSVDDSSKFSALKKVDSTDPFSQDIADNPLAWCSRLSLIQFNASTSSYDDDELSSASDLGISDINALVDTVGDGEGITGNDYFVGENGTDNNQLCTAKKVDDLSKVRGTCPDEPRLSGTYYSAGLAHFAHTNDIRSDLASDQLPEVFGVSLAPARPRVIVPVPGTKNGQTITILPSCRNSSVQGNCALVDFKIVSQTSSGSTNSGQIYINWEDSEQGGDFDQDMWGLLSYEVTATHVKITTDVVNQSTPYGMGFGYILSGTKKDGFHVHSGINSFSNTDSTGATNCSSCVVGDAATSYTYDISSLDSDAQTLEQPLYYAAKWGGFKDMDNSKTPNQVFEWDADKNGTPDRYFLSIDPAKLETSLKQAFADAARAFASSASVATNSTRFQTDSLIYEAKFHSDDWSGQLLAISLVSEDLNGNGALDSTEDTNSNGTLDVNIIGSQIWEAGSLIPAFGDRKIFSFNPEATGLKGIEFKWDQLNNSQKVVLDNTTAGNTSSTSSPIVDYLRGVQTLELNDKGSYRIRSTLLGDIVNSNPAFVGQEDYGYSKLSDPEGSSYTIFRQKKEYKDRPAMIYVGANDGMLHGFNASSSADGGKEVLAYVPNSAISPELVSLTSINYVHHYFVDGSPKAGDAYFDSAWHTVLVGSTGAGKTTEIPGATGLADGTGGGSIFALDVTNPTSFSASNVLWEFSTRQDDDLGFTIPQTSIVRLANKSWAVLAGNGYNSDSGKAVLFIFDVKDGSIIQKLEADVGTGNGLSGPAPYDSDGDGVVDYIYAGDLKGNVWKFDVTDGDSDKWNVANSKKPLYQAVDRSGVAQPITVRVTVAKADADGQAIGTMVYFGTGKYFEVGDSVVSDSTQVETFYGVWDNCDLNSSASCDSSLSGRSLLQQQAILYDLDGGTLSDGTVISNRITVVSNCEVAYSSTPPKTTDSPCTANVNRRGWYLDFISPGKDATGEKIVSDAIIRSDKVIFTTLVPVDDICSPGGNGSLAILDENTGSRISYAATDLNKDGIVDDKDLVKGPDGKTYQVASIDLELGIIKTPAIVEGATQADGSKLVTAITVGSGGSDDTINIKEPPTTGGGGSVASGKRVSWRQLR